MKTRPTPASSNVRLNRGAEGNPHDKEWECRSIIGKMNFLEKSTRVGVSCTVHQCADPKESHAQAVKCIGRHLLRTCDKGCMINPRDHSFDAWADADFVGIWDRECADAEPSMAKSQTGHVAMHGCSLIIWGSASQREVTSLSTETKHIAISESLRPTIEMMQLIDDSQRIGWQASNSSPAVKCEVFKDNSGAPAMAQTPKMRPRTKHTNAKMHHFREHVLRGLITIHEASTELQLGDIATKPQPRPLFESQRESAVQWDAELATKEELLLPAKHV